MIIVTGDPHGVAGIGKILRHNFPISSKMTEDDWLLFTGDTWFAGDDELMAYLDSLGFNIGFVDGNHERFDILDGWPESEVPSGEGVAGIDPRFPHVCHLLRGHSYVLSDHRVFAMGGARSLDGDIAARKAMMAAASPDSPYPYPYSVRELPSEDEYETARQTLLDNRDDSFGLILTHCLPLHKLGMGEMLRRKIPSLHVGSKDRLTEFLGDEVLKANYFTWLAGHYHCNEIVDLDTFVLFDKFVTIDDHGYAHWLPSCDMGVASKACYLLDGLPAWSDMPPALGWSRCCEGFAYVLSSLSNEFGFVVKRLSFEDWNGVLRIKDLEIEGDVHPIAEAEIKRTMELVGEESMTYCKICGSQQDIDCVTFRGKGGYYCREHAEYGLEKLKASFQED